MTRLTGGWFPPGVEIERGNILDLGCGPGGWALEVARAYPEIELFGIDISNIMIAYAQMSAKLQQVQDRVQFQVQDLTKFPWPFADATFDMVNARFMVGFLLQEQWPHVLAECFRVVKPGGIISLSEPEWATTSSLAGEKLRILAVRALHRAGLGFSLDGTNIGIIHMLYPLLQQCGGKNIEYAAYVLNMAYDAPFHQAGVKNNYIAYQLMSKLFARLGLATEEEVQQLCEQFRADSYQPTFASAMIMARAWGYKEA
jgi:ubiquinone/menaquinone biosynthesis C-methylase UbiE